MASRTELFFDYQQRCEIRERAGWKCEECGVKFNEDEAYRLYCHHVLQVKFAEMFPELSSAVIGNIINGRALCSKCHQKRDRWAENHPEEAAAWLQQKAQEAGLL